MGFTDDDLAGEGSDRLVDAVVAPGDLDSVLETAAGHLRAGADAVAMQALVPGGETLPEQWDKLGPAGRSVSASGP